MARRRISGAQRRLQELRGRLPAGSAPGPPEDSDEEAEQEEAAIAPHPEPEAVAPEDPAWEPEGLEDPRAEAPAEAVEEAPRESIASRLRALRGADPSEGGGRRASLGQPARREDPDAAAPAAQASGATALGEARQRISDLWNGMPATRRVRIAAFAIVAALAALLLLVLVPAAPCEAPGGDTCPAGDDAIGLLPDDSLAYLHLDVDPDSEQYQEAADLSSRLPLLSKLAVGAVSSLADAPFDYASDVQPWASGQVAMALLPGTGSVERVLMIGADDEDAARDFGEGLLGPDPTTREVGDAQLSVGERGLAATLLDGFLLVGDEDALATLVDPPEDAGSLEDAASSALDELPDSRLAYGYLSAAGARTLLGGDPSLSSLDTFVDADASAGAAAALSVDGGAIDLTVRSELDPQRAETSPNFFAALPRFEPQLDADVSAGALAYLGLGDPGGSIESLLSQAAVSAPDFLAAFNRAEEGLRREGGISVTDDLLPLLGSEAAIAIEPVAAENVPETPGVIPNSGVPYLSLMAQGVDADAASKSLADLQTPLVEALAPVSSGRVPAFEEQDIGGVVAQSLVINPDVELTYATFDDRLVVATNPLGVEQATADGDGLASSDAFGLATENLPDQLSLLAYLDLQDLLAIGEQAGLAEDPAYATYAQDLRNLDSAAIGVDGSGEAIRTDLRITVGEPDPVGAEAPTLGGE